MYVDRQKYRKTDRQTDRQRDMTKQMVAFNNFTKTPKNVHTDKTNEG